MRLLGISLSRDLHAFEPMREALERLAGKNCFKVRDFELSGFIEQHHRVESRTVVGVLPRQNFQNLGRAVGKRSCPQRMTASHSTARWLSLPIGAKEPSIQLQ